MHILAPRLLIGGCEYDQVHAARPHDHPFRQSTWRKANPSQPFMPDLLSALQREAARALKGIPKDTDVKSLGYFGAWASKYR